MIDTPLIELIHRFNEFPYCFTLQCCYGHFTYKGQDNPHNLEPLPVTDRIEKVKYQIAYIALCIQNSPSGQRFLEELKEIPSLDPQNVQFGCARWFWERQVNSYVLQVEPDRFQDKDQAVLDYKEAVHIEKIRNEFFHRLKKFTEYKGNDSSVSK